jgi:hypothetical protein
MINIDGAPFAHDYRRDKAIIHAAGIATVG